MIVIAHRGLMQGPNDQTENSPEAIEQAINAGFMVEVDINTLAFTGWTIDTESSAAGEKHDFVIGHEGGCYYPVTLDYVIDIAPYTYFHCKDLTVLNHLLHLRCVPYLFFHDKDAGVMTTDGKIWTYPGQPVYKNSIAVLPENWNPDISLEANLNATKELDCYGICTDWAWQVRKFVN